MALSPGTSVNRKSWKFLMFYHHIMICLCITNNLCYSCYIIDYRCKWVKIDGDEYKLSGGVILNVVYDLPTEGIIQDIYIVNGDRVTFNVEEFSTSYEPHYRAYILQCSSFSRIVFCSFILQFIYINLVYQICQIFCFTLFSLYM